MEEHHGRWVGSDNISPKKGEQTVTKLRDKLIDHDLIDGVNRYGNEYIGLAIHPSPFRSSPFNKRTDHTGMRDVGRSVLDGVLGCGFFSWTDGLIVRHISDWAFKNSD